MKQIFYFFGMNIVSIIMTTVHAEQITIYRQNDGTALLTNMNKPEYHHLKVIQKNYYPESNVHTYKNYGATEAAVPKSYQQQQNNFDDLIQQASQQYGVSAGLIKAIMHTESGFNVHARSPVGAQGLMQLMPATARRFHVSDVYDPKQNIFAGTKYLSWLLKRFNGNMHLAIAAYNAGEGNIDKYGGIPPFRETQDYVRRVISRFQNLYTTGLSAHSISTQSPQPKSSTYSQQNIMLADDIPTNTSIGTYSTKNATASANIQINNTNF